MTSDQDAGVCRLFEHDETVLIADMGAGKTVVALTAIEELLAEGVLDKVLVFAPLKVCQTVWREERDKWEHLWDEHASASSNVVDVYVGYLRKKLERPNRPKILHTRRGEGYVLAEGEPS